MRKVLFTFISLFITISSCVNQPKENVHSLLEQIDGMIRVAPDTAYCLLQQLPVTESTSQADSAYRELLLLEAQLRNDIRLKDTLSVRSLADFYKGRKDTVMLARSYRLWAATYRDLGLDSFQETVDHYNTAIALAGAKDEKQVLADASFELANVYYYELLSSRKEAFRVLADSLFYLTEQTAEALNDTVLWINSLLSHRAIPDGLHQYAEMERQLLLALRLSEEAGLNGYEANAAMLLSGLYAILGEKEKSFLYAQRDLALRKGLISDDIYCFVLGNAYERIGMKDSADYHRKKGEELKYKKHKTESSKPHQHLPENFNPENTSIEELSERLKMDTEQQRQISRERTFTFILILTLVVIGFAVLFYLRRLHLRKTTFQDVLLEQAKSRLQQGEEILQQKENELSLIQRQVDVLSSGFSTTSVFDKIEQIIEEKLYKDSSSLCMEKSDWKQLQFEMDKQWDYAVTQLQDEYQLTDSEVRLLCLNLTDVPTSHIPYLLEKSVNTIYVRNRQLCSKLGIIRNNGSTFKEDFKYFIKNRG